MLLGVFGGMQVQGESGRGDAIVPVKLDVTKEESVKAAALKVEASLPRDGPGLVGVINCAGVGYTG